MQQHRPLNLDVGEAKNDRYKALSLVFQLRPDEVILEKIVR
jgi:hypothetical protein